MSKKLYFILLPIFLLLFNTGGRADNSVSFTHDDMFSAIAGKPVDFHTLPVTNTPPARQQGLNSKKNHKLKNLIRIKARHDVISLDFSFTAGIFITPVFYFAPRALCGRHSYQPLFAAYGCNVLRGPPAV